ncbi:MAG: 6-phosphogluconolactonase [Anaerolinea sp.]|nr:6-phosphogluconolactonase [Anaerolinea sp.]
MNDELPADAAATTGDQPVIKPLKVSDRPAEQASETVASHRPGVREYLNPIELAHAAADRIAAAAESAVSARGRFTIALSGGQTPVPLLELLASPEYASRIDWEFTHVFWVDERCVPLDNRQSNYHLAREHLLQHVPIPWAHIHRIEGELPPEEAAARYDAHLHDFFIRRLQLERARFDIMLLGMGADGHTASLFPGSPLLHEQQRWAAATPELYHGLYRVTLTYPALNAAALILMMVSGEEKADAVRRTLRGPHDVNVLPAQGIRPDRGELIWLLDRAAARLLDQPDQIE